MVYHSTLQSGEVLEGQQALDDMEVEQTWQAMQSHGSIKGQVVESCFGTNRNPNSNLKDSKTMA